MKKGIFIAVLFTCLFSATAFAGWTNSYVPSQLYSLTTIDGNNACVVTLNGSQYIFLLNSDTKTEWVRMITSAITNNKGIQLGINGAISETSVFGAPLPTSLVVGVAINQ